jgi:hypothetical protein
MPAVLLFTDVSVTKQSERLVKLLVFTFLWNLVTDKMFSLNVDIT